jgi:DNA topoisomerase-3
MQNAWRFIKDEALRERLKEAKGIGTPATRAEIIKGSSGRISQTAVVPGSTSAGAAPRSSSNGCRPASFGTTSLPSAASSVVVGKADFRTVIDEIAGEATGDHGAPI